MTPKLRQVQLGAQGTWSLSSPAANVGRVPTRSDTPNQIVAPAEQVALPVNHLLTDHELTTVFQRLDGTSTSGRPAAARLHPNTVDGQTSEQVVSNDPKGQQSADQGSGLAVKESPILR